MSLDSPSIVVVDGHCLNPGDLSWQRLDALGRCTFHDRTAREQLAERIRNTDIVLTNKVVLSRDLISELPQLKYIGVTATGYNIVDIRAARERGIVVTNVPTYGTTSVAQMVFAHLLNLTQHVAEHAQAVRDGRWASSPDFCFWDFPLLELDGMTMGIIGFGQIGQATARLANAFGMRVLVYSRSRIAESHGVHAASLETVFRESDVVSLHCPLVPETARMVSRDRLALMKPTALLINTSRGGLVDEAALAEALNAGRLAGAGLDVLDVEPPSESNPLYRAKNCYITPHNAWATRSSRQRLLDAAVDNVAAFLRGEARNVVNMENAS
ncbi:MAG TPA: D-2-hydroxyacid dehydrogenase [Lacipirellulaceae bacterium]|nr:D-2-hydroxyacid dehydrogenase [Lacipirellulaceae bacterium]